MTVRAAFKRCREFARGRSAVVYGAGGLRRPDRALRRSAREAVRAAKVYALVAGERPGVPATVELAVRRESVGASVFDSISSAERTLRGFSIGRSTRCRARTARRGGSTR